MLFIDKINEIYLLKMFQKEHKIISFSILKFSIIALAILLLYN